MLIKSIFIAALSFFLTGFSLPLEKKSLVGFNNLISQSSQEQLTTDAVAIEQIVIQDVVTDLQLSPEYKVEVSDIVVNGNYGMAGWLVGHVGGLLFLKRTGTGWVVLPGTGGGVPGVEDLVGAGIPRTVAQSFLDYLSQ